MKNLFASALILFLSASLYAQVAQSSVAVDDVQETSAKIDNDIIIDIMGDSLIVKITQIGSDDVTYLKTGSSIPYGVKKSDISSIVFASGEVLELNPLAGNSDDARSIVLTREKSDIKGLQHLGEVVGRQATIIAGKGRDYEDSAFLKAQESALELGGKIMLVTKEKIVIAPGSSFFVVKAEVYK